MAFSSGRWLVLAGEEAVGDDGLRTGDTGGTTTPDACRVPCQSPGEGDRVVWRQSPGRDSTFLVELPPASSVGSASLGALTPIALPI